MQSYHLFKIPPGNFEFSCVLTSHRYSSLRLLLWPINSFPSMLQRAIFLFLCSCNFSAFHQCVCSSHRQGSITPVWIYIPHKRMLHTFQFNYTCSLSFHLQKEKEERRRKEKKPFKRRRFTTCDHMTLPRIRNNMTHTSTQMHQFLDLIHYNYTLRDD